MDKQLLNKSQKKSNNQLFPIIVLILLFILVLGYFSLRKYYFSNINASNSDSSEKVSFTIEEGQSVDSITNDLISAELLKKDRKTVFKLYLKLEELAPTIQAGNFSIPRNLNIKQLANTLQSGGINEIWVQVPEGIRIDEVADVLTDEINSNGGEFSSDEFMSLVNDQTFIKERVNLGIETENLEGFLFPDKYLVPIASTEEEIILMMVETFKSKINQIGESFTYEDVIVASMIEREGRSLEDKKIISDVIRKRLEEGWYLEIDATLLYPKKDWKHVITVQDKEEDNPYNTYKSLGLPPTPICSPAYNSLLASLEPTDTDYYYYIHEDDGTPHYSETYSEHLNNVNKYLRNE